MRRHALAAVIGSLRQVLAILVALVAVAGTAYLVTHRLSNPTHYAYGGCPPHAGTTLIVPGHPLCAPPTRYAWQIPLAVMIAIGGLGTAAVLGGSAERRALRV